VAPGLLHAAPDTPWREKDVHGVCPFPPSAARLPRMAVCVVLPRCRHMQRAMVVTVDPGPDGAPRRLNATLFPDPSVQHYAFTVVVRGCPGPRMPLPHL